MAEKRRIKNLLPGYLQTKPLTKMFSATADHLFQPVDLDFLSGYIGDKPAWYNSQQDFYISESDNNRTNYQLSPTVVSKDPLKGQITQALFYEDLIGSLRFQGSNINNHDRLFSGEYYSWSPPIDIDKFVNFSNYYWLSPGPNSIILLDQTDLINDLNDVSNYTYNGSYQFSSNGDIQSGELIFTNGLKITPNNDLTLSLNGSDYYIEGVGREIILIFIPPDRNPSWDVKPWDTTGWDGEEPSSRQYSTISRASSDNNQWSQFNRWFHIDVIKLSNTYIFDPAPIQAARPIIEFDSGIELYNYGTNNRGTVDVIDTVDGDVLGSIVGRSSFSINGIILQDGMTILVTADLHPDTNNRIYMVTGVSLGSIELLVQPNGNDLTGAPQLNDRVDIRFGPYEDYNTYYTGSSWSLTGQQKIGIIAPLFHLYDIDGNAIDDPSIYPSSSFTGNNVFAYQTSPTSLFDTQLGLNVQLNEFGDYLFNNAIATSTITYISDLQIVPYYGYMFAKISTLTDVEFVNSWYKAPNNSRQYIVNEFNISSITYSVEIDQTPAEQLFNSLPTIIVTQYNTDFTTSLLVNDVDYTLMGQTVVFTNPIDIGNRLIIKSWNPLTPTTLTGYYELPINLTANPNNLPINSLSRGQFLQHFVEILQNQTGFIGKSLGDNNYRDTYRERGLGLSILQHRAPLIKLALLNSTPFSDPNITTSYIDPMVSMQFAERSYQRFYNKFLQTLFTLVRQSGILPDVISGCDPYNISQLLLSVYKQVNLGKSINSPWVNSGPDGLPGRYCTTPSINPTYVPPTATRLGMTPAYLPTVYIDYSQPTSPLVIQTHDGSRIVMVDEAGNQLGNILHEQSSTTNPTQLTNPVAAAWLQFENDLFLSMPTAYNDTEATLVFDTRQYSPGKWRNSDYSISEYVSLQRGAFDKWTTSNQINFSSNTSFNIVDQFTLNYSTVTDRQGLPVPGYWQGIYRWFYDTDRPHTNPWEMLGFSQKPSWWDSEYGSAPYTNGNTYLWEDLSNGIIRHGPRSGTYVAWARPGLLSCIPVDNQGNLLTPYMAGTVASIPSVSEAQADWIFGDGGPVESAWIYSQDYNFVLAETGYLMKPAAFIEYTWDNLRTQKIFPNTNYSQWIYTDTNSRRNSNQFFVQRENPSLITSITIPNESSLTYFGSGGIQHWISEYLVNQSLSVSNYFGSIIRGGDVQLAHRMAGYVTADTFRGLVDSFGDIGYSTRLIPNENINIYLYKSSSINESFYGGIIIEQVANGWKVYGYNTISPMFTIIPSNVKGSKSTVVIGNQKVIEYTLGLTTTQNIRYGTIFDTRQDVYDFIVSYGRWLESEGWSFSEFDNMSNTVIDWKTSAREYLFWSQGNWANGTFIALSPSADNVTFTQEYGTVQYVNGIVAGTYPIIDRSGTPIQGQNINVVRNNNDITVQSTNDQGIYGLRLFTTTLEHAVFFDNITSFNDTIYDPLYDLQQQRIHIYCYRSNDWDGRLDAPGFILLQNSSSNTWTMTSNFEKTADDVRKYFNIDEPKTFNQINPITGATTSMQSTIANIDRQDISKLAKHLIAYQTRPYLQDLLLEDATEFEFYQGFIKQKGTKSVINSLFRNTAILPPGATFEYFEEWLIRIGYYGATSLNNNIDFILLQSKITSDPQWIRLFSQNFSDIPNQPVFDIVPHDPLIVNPPETYPTNLFQARLSYTSNAKTDLPSAGYAMLGDTNWYVANTAELLSLYNTQSQTFTPLKDRDTIWQFITDTGDWNIWILTLALGQVSTTIASVDTNAPTYITTTAPHGLLPGDICIIFGVSNVPQINGTYIIFNITPTSFQINLSTYQPGLGGTIMVYRTKRFATTFLRDSGEPPEGWEEGDLVYIDNGGIVNNAWTIYRYHNSIWLPFRQQEYKIDASLITESVLYSSTTNNILTNISYFDPLKGRISGQADVEISYKTIYDPAKYNSGDSSGFAVSDTEAWSSAQLGLVWWDLSTVRYIDYEQGDESYRVQQWGKLAPGTSIDVYEWIRSSVPPTSWAVDVAQGIPITDGNNTFIPSGTIKNINSPNWTETTEFNNNGVPTTYYYFWVANSGLAPAIPSRTYTTASLASLIFNPNTSGEAWYAAISSRSILVGNIQGYLNDDTVVMKINYTSQTNNQNIYSEWQLVREGDAFSPIDNNLWNKMKDSLTSQVLRGTITGDTIGDDVPDYTLNQLNKYGNSIRPRQSWVIDRESASALFISTFNTLLSTSITPIIGDTSKVNWINYFNLSESEPTQIGNWNFHVVDLTQRDDLIGSIGDGQTVLVDPVSSTGNVWTIWQYSQIVQTWTLIRQQSYNTNNYWKYIDWYAAGYGPLTTITQSVEMITDLDTLNPISGQVSQVLNNGVNKWQLYAFLSNMWILVGQQDATIEVLSTIYDWQTAFNGFSGQGFDTSPFDQTASVELANIIDGIKHAIYSTPNSIELNTLFFAMINYVVSEQGYVDWIIKTSNIVLKGFNEPLTQSTLLEPDYTNSILGFINEAKPYHAKVREFITGKTVMDTPGLAISDFDVPPGYLGYAMILPGSNIGENINSVYAQGNKTTLIANQSADYDLINGIDISNLLLADVNGSENYALNNTFASWYNNYKSNATLIRTLKIQMLFDRILTSQRENGWGVIWNSNPWDLTNAQSSEGAFGRIDQYYSPLNGMPPKDIDSLIGGAEYRGIILRSLDLNLEIGWSVSPWDSQFGFDADQQAIDNYLDLIVQGGLIPKYDMAIGNGEIKSFPLTRITGNPNDMVVWSDGNIRKYGIDWIVPASAIDAEIVDGGNNMYLVGEILEVIAGDSIQIATITITSMISGQVVSIKVLSGGEYNTVSNGPYYCQYPISQPGLGNKLLIDIDWTCENIIFLNPPNSSLTPNIYVLYVGTTFEPAPTSSSDTIFEGNHFIQPNIDDNHPEELFPFAIKDSFIMDVRSSSFGGRPMVYTSIYQTDGIKAIFNLPVVPQSDVAILAYLNGNLLVVGPTNDFVINYSEKKLVFVIPPISGILSITTISVGGASREIESITPFQYGSGYIPGDTIVLSGPTVLTPPSIIIDTVCATGTSIISGGSGYNIGDKLILIDISSDDDPVVLEVSSVVMSNGRIMSVEIFNIGSISNIPSSINWITTRTNINNNANANISLNWGALSASVINAGMFARLPTQPVSQISTSGIGTDAQWLLRFTGDYQTFEFVQTDQTTYNLPNIGNIIASQLQVNVDGTIISNVNVIISSDTVISLPSNPLYGSLIEISNFDNSLYSTVVDTELNISNAEILTYNLTQLPGDTEPNYLSTFVRQNGRLLSPPNMQQFVGDGFTYEFDITITLNGNSYVYVDQILDGISSNISNQSITFTSPPLSYSDIQIVNIDSSTNYLINGNTITFNSNVLTNGDDIHITTFREDVDYEFHTEEYGGIRPGDWGISWDTTGWDIDDTSVYILTKNPYEGSILVWVNGILMSPGIDYIIVSVDINDGWSTHGWNTTPWDEDFHSTVAVKLGTQPTFTTDIIVITYMTGLPYRSATNWRTVIAGDNSLSTVLDPNRLTTLISNVYINDNRIQIDDYTILTPPLLNSPGAIWINSELIYFTQIEFAPTASNANRAWLSGLQRSRFNTSNEPQAIYTSLFYNGDGISILFAAEAVDSVINTSVWIDNNVLTLNVDYMFVDNPISHPAGHYVQFTKAPMVGYKNIKIISLKTDSLNVYVSHNIGDDVYDAGGLVQFNYNWESSPLGLQYNRSSQSDFLLDHGLKRS